VRMKVLPDYWANPEDFAALFQYLWHRDLPIDLKSTGAKRIDWTIHIGIIVRSIGDLTGFVTRFEKGGRKDAIFKSVAGDEVAIEWEWEGIKGQNELKKLKEHKVWGRDGYDHMLLKYGVLVTYVETNELKTTLADTSEYWKDASWPLLLILIASEKSKKLASRRDFTNMQMYLFESNGEYRLLRDVPAMPWKVDCSRWQFQLLDRSI